MGCGRFAPSPTGRMHLGNVYSVLLAWLSSRSKGDEFIVRMEDIDERCRNIEHRELILDDLAWLGLDFDGVPTIQSQRTEIHAEALERVSELARVYPCFCSRAELHAASAPHASDGTPIYAGTCKNLSDAEIAERSLKRSPALRVEVPQRTVSFIDGNLGEYSQDLAGECGDFLLRRSDGVFAYQLVVVVDDAAAGVTEVVRGSDLISSTPRQIWLNELLGNPIPNYCHHPLLLAPDGKRLSKREKSLDMGSLREQFASAEELLGWLAYFAGIIDEVQEVSASELAKVFDWAHVATENIVLKPFGPVKNIY